MVKNAVGGAHTVRPATKNLFQNIDKAFKLGYNISRQGRNHLAVSLSYSSFIKMTTSIRIRGSHFLYVW